MGKLTIGNRVLDIPLVQGGMGVAVSRSSLAGAVAAEGGMGTISTAQIGYDEEGFETDQEGCNLKAIAKHIALAKQKANGRGMIAVNVMVALNYYKEHVKAAIAAGADAVVCGAGLPMDLPGIVKEAVAAGGRRPCIAPIVSSARAAVLVLRNWDRHYSATADFIVAEGPKAGGHLGFSREELADIPAVDFDSRVKEIIESKKTFEDKYGHKIPLIVAGGIFTAEDVCHALELGADGVQVASRFVATEECDASDAFKQAYIAAGKDDIQIVQSPVGMPGRAIRNAFIKRIEHVKDPIRKCYNCLAKCDPKTVPYCITQALTNAVKGDLDHGLIFCGAETWRINEITTVRALVGELTRYCE